MDYPIESPAAYRQVAELVEEEVRKDLEKIGFALKSDRMGWCHMYRSIKNRALRDIRD